MGCGSSSTNVQTFTPDNKREDSWIRNGKPSRKSSASSVKSSASRKKVDRSSPPRTPPQKPSSASRRRSSRENSANTSRTYTVDDHRPKDEPEDLTQVQTIQNNNNNEARDSNMPFSAIEPTESREERHERRAKEIEAIWARDSHKRRKIELPKAPKMTAFVIIEPSESREERHERRVREIEAVWAEDYVQKRNDYLERFGIDPLEIPPRNEEDPLPEVTIDDICSHNESGGDWFKYGRKVYSKDKIKSIIVDHCSAIRNEKEKMFMNPDEAETIWKYLEMDPMRVARKYGITIKERQQVLAVCHVANVIDIPRDEYQAKQKEFHEYLLDEVQNAESETLVDVKNQTLRWLEAYPNIDESHIEPGSDPNEAVFPLPTNVDPNTLRSYIETWEPIDTEVPAEGAWWHFGDEQPVVDGEPYAFAENLKINEGPEYTQLDTTIAGEAGWNLIELDLFKNDMVTDNQADIWKSRETRGKYLNDPTWMEKRRMELFNAMVVRYEWDLQNREPYCDIYLNIGNSWKKLQELSESDFDPSKKSVKTVDKDSVVGIDEKQSEGIQTRDNGDINSSRISVRSHSSRQQTEGDALELAVVTGAALGSRASSARSNGSRKGSATSVTRGISEDAERLSSARSNSSRKGSANSATRSVSGDAGNAPLMLVSTQSDGSRKGSASSSTRSITEDSTKVSGRVSSAQSNASERISSAKNNGSRKGSASSVNRDNSENAGIALERISSARSNASERISSARSNGSRKGSASSATRVTSEDAGIALERVSSAKSNASERSSSAQSIGSRKGSASSTTKVISEDANNPPERLSSAQSLGSRKGSANSATRATSEDAGNASERISSAKSNASERVSSARSNGSRKGSANSATRATAEDAGNASERISSAKSNASERVSSARSNGSRKGSANSASRKISEDAGNTAERVSSARSTGSRNGSAKSASRETPVVKPASDDGLEVGEGTPRGGDQVVQNGQAPNIDTMDSGLDLNSPEN